MSFINAIKKFFGFEQPAQNYKPFVLDGPAPVAEAPQPKPLPPKGAKAKVAMTKPALTKAPAKSKTKKVTEDSIAPAAALVDTGDDLTSTVTQAVLMTTILSTPQVESAPTIPDTPVCSPAPSTVDPAPYCAPDPSPSYSSSDFGSSSGFDGGFSGGSDFSSF